MIQLLLSMTLFLAPTDSRLNEVSTEVCPCEIPSEEIQGILDQMVEVAFGNTKDRSKSILVGLAAPQIGIQKRIILVDVAATGVFTKDAGPPPPQIKEYINPEILWKSDELTYWREGCFSTSRIFGIVPRAAKVLIRAYNRQGDILTEEFAGYTARIFQHEIDHLDGIRFPDRITNDDNLHWVELDETPEYRIHWASWQKRVSREAWDKLKNGNPLD